MYKKWSLYTIVLGRTNVERTSAEVLKELVLKELVLNRSNTAFQQLSPLLGRHPRGALACGVYWLTLGNPEISTHWLAPKCIGLHPRFGALACTGEMYWLALQRK